MKQHLTDVTLLTTTRGGIEFVTGVVLDELEVAIPYESAVRIDSGPTHATVVSLEVLAGSVRSVSASEWRGET